MLAREEFLNKLDQKTLTWDGAGQTEIKSLLKIIDTLILDALSFAEHNPQNKGLHCFIQQIVSIKSIFFTHFVENSFGNQLNIDKIGHIIESLTELSIEIERVLDGLYYSLKDCHNMLVPTVKQLNIKLSEFENVFFKKALDKLDQKILAWDGERIEIKPLLKIINRIFLDSHSLYKDNPQDRCLQLLIYQVIKIKTILFNKFKNDKFNQPDIHRISPIEDQLWDSLNNIEKESEHYHTLLSSIKQLGEAFQDFLNLSGKRYGIAKIQSLKTEAFLTWTQWIANHPENFFDRSNTWLSECWCPGYEHSHSRLSSENPRKQIETQILEKLTVVNHKKTIFLLSLGSGGLLQDLVIVLKLYHAGFKKIHLRCIEIAFNKSQQDIFTAITNKLNQRDAKIIIEYNATLPMDTVYYDIIYAIDFDKLSGMLAGDFSSRPFSDSVFCQTKQSYLAFSLILEAYSKLSHEPHAFYIASFFGNQFTFTPKEPVTKFKKQPEFIKELDEKIKLGYVCIHKNPFSLIRYLPLFIKQGVSILINQTILDEKEKKSMKILLTQYHVSFKICDEKLIEKTLDEGCEQALIIHESSYNLPAYTFFNSKKERQPKPNIATTCPSQQVLPQIGSQQITLNEPTPKKSLSSFFSRSNANEVQKTNNSRQSLCTIF